MRLRRKATTPSQAWSSNVSISRGAGTTRRSWSMGTGQCANRRSCQDCAMSHGPRGSCAILTFVMMFRIFPKHTIHPIEAVRFAPRRGPGKRGKLVATERQAFGHLQAEHVVVERDRPRQAGDV